MKYFITNAGMDNHHIYKSTNDSTILQAAAGADEGDVPERCRALALLPRRGPGQTVRH